MVARIFRRRKLPDFGRPSESGFLSGQTHFNRGLGKLVVQLAPLAHPQVRQKILAAPLHQLLVGQAFVALALEAVPNVQVGNEIGLLVSKTLVGLGCGIARFQRPLARVLNRQRGRDYQYFRHAVVLLRRQQNARDFRVDGQARHLFAEGGEAVAVWFFRRRVGVFCVLHGGIGVQAAFWRSESVECVGDY